MVFFDEDAVFCDEGQYEHAIENYLDIDSAVVISASGTKHAPIIIQKLISRRLPVFLITCSPDSPAAALLPKERVFATRSRKEPITYNTSTYMGMILTITQEKPGEIKRHLLDKVRPLIPDFSKYKAFYLIIDPKFEIEIPMFITKFDELFGGRINGRCYTTEQTLHAKTVVPWDKELFVAFGCDNDDFGSERLYIPLPEKADFVAMMATGYYVIGHIQSQMPSWFKENAESYARIQKELFARAST
jgi:hypothetical protein